MSTSPRVAPMGWWGLVAAAGRRKAGVRLAIDTGGTFTDLVLERAGEYWLYKAPSTPDDPVVGVIDVLEAAAHDHGRDLPSLLADAELVVHGTTLGVNAVLTGRTARTAFLTTQGHPDILLFREGGRTQPFNFARPYPEPYVPRSLTYEIPERVGAFGEVVRPLDEDAVVGIITDLRERSVEAVAVCLLWSIANPVHEARVGELLQEHLPGIPFTLSHQLNPIIREYRRASSTAIDASLKPIASRYFTRLAQRLRRAGFDGRLLVVTSSGGLLDADAVADAPIHSIGSGPAMAPVAGRFYAGTDGYADTAIVADAGGTSYDVSLVRRGRLPTTQETWIGERFFGHMTGFPSVEVRSIGAGGGSIAWVDQGGVLHVGPESAGAVPGPACYGSAGRRPTVTDACLVLGLLDPHFFLGGTKRLDVAAAREAIKRDVASRLSLEVDDAAAAILKLVTEHMAGAIAEITIAQGIDPRGAVLVGGGGAAGFNVVQIARRLGCARVVIPAVGAALSAAGGLLSDLTREQAALCWATSEVFDYERVNEALASLERRGLAFVRDAGSVAVEPHIEFFAEARYPNQVWEISVPLRRRQFTDAEDVDALRADFHALHEELFAVSDRESHIEIVNWRARATARLNHVVLRPARTVSMPRPQSMKQARFGDRGWLDSRVEILDELAPGIVVEGPAIVDSPFTTVVVDPDASACRTATGSLLIWPWPRTDEIPIDFAARDAVA